MKHYEGWPKKKTIEEIRDWLLENAVEVHWCNGKSQTYLNLSGLDLSDFDGTVLISDMKVKEYLYQSCQEVGLGLSQSFQKVGGTLFQNNQTVGGSLYQDNQNYKGEFTESKHFDKKSFTRGLVQELWTDKNLILAELRAREKIYKKEKKEYERLTSEPHTLIPVSKRDKEYYQSIALAKFGKEHAKEELDRWKKAIKEIQNKEK